MRKCKTCNEPRELREYYANGTRLRPVCRYCYLQKKRDKYHEKKAKVERDFHGRPVTPTESAE